MKLISCNECGVVLDQDKLKFADCIEDEEGGIDLSKGEYDQHQRDFYAYISCPACGDKVFKE